MKHSGTRTLRVLASLTVAIALVAATAAWGSAVGIPGESGADPFELHSVGDTIFEPQQPGGYNSDCALGDIGSNPDDNLGFTPATDGRSEDGVSDDAFDGGLIVAVGDQIFEDEDAIGDLVGEQLTVGPTKLGGLKVTRVELALQSSPTLRSLIRLKNSKKHKKVARTLTWDSDLGADGEEFVATTTNGDTSLTDTDRWLVADDEGIDDDGDPTFVLFGKGKGVRKTKVANPISDRDSCVRWTIRVKVPARSSRYLLFFTEIHDDGDRSGEAGDAAKFDTKKPGGDVLAGLKKSVKKKVLNWDLVKERRK